MSFATQKIAGLGALAACALLGACSGAPSESQLKSAFETRMQADAKALDRTLGQGTSQKILGEITFLRKIGCKEDGEKAYQCDIEMQATRNGTTLKRPMPLRFVKGSDGWVLSK